MQKVLADDYFNPALLDIDNPSQGKTDLSIFEIGPGQAPGKYHVDVFVNNNKVAAKEIEFTLKKDASGKSTLQPCLSAAQLKSFGINIDKYVQDDKAQCIDLSLIPSASATFHGLC
ncbi:FimD/PapC N-terminal domain-containing protein [Enterobacter sichuanensis]|uniref:FimD/PapC N-terminal domain-containing protein n=1 Tax=Enterobacter sichuanensis TaxID=2071710 RepID=UPI002814178F|nr:FimD/PapC N-terminal domain-containing protein [Enterobacter sichuanensis]MDR0174680.1 FimD/PapC N-terminal domain-containing protein [Enterobacter sichuanensis]